MSTHPLAVITRPGARRHIVAAPGPWDTRIVTLCASHVTLTRGWVATPLPLSTGDGLDVAALRVLLPNDSHACTRCDALALTIVRCALIADTGRPSIYIA